MASVLAVAVLGVMLVTAFAYSLRVSIGTMHLDTTVGHDLESNVAKLGGLEAPADLDPKTRSNVRDAITDAFVFGFRIIMVVCAGLAIASATTAWRMIPARGATTDS